MVVSHYRRIESCKNVLEATGTNPVYQDENRLSVYMPVQVILKSTKKPQPPKKPVKKQKPVKELF